MSSDKKLLAIIGSLLRLETLTAATAPRDEEDEEKLLGKRDVADRLGVSCRWIERHLRPTLQARRGGRSWYRWSDVVEQVHTKPSIALSGLKAGGRKGPDNLPRPSSVRLSRLQMIEDVLRSGSARRRR